MSFLCSSCKSIWNTILLTGSDYKSLREEEEETMENDMYINGDRSEGSPYSRRYEGGPQRNHGPSARARRNNVTPAAATPDRARASWRKNLGSRLSWISKPFHRGRSRDGRQPQPQFQREEDSRLLPTIPVNSEPRLQVDPSRRLFQDKLDLCSESEIIEECQALNYKVYSEILTMMHEWVQSPTLSRRRQGDEANVALIKSDQEYLRSAIGATLFYSIKRARSYPPSEELQTRVQDALQAAAAYVLFDLISTTFCPGLPHYANAAFHSTFKHMLSKESQVTALRWRALAYTHSNQEPALAKYKTERIGQLSRVFTHTFILAAERQSSDFVYRMHERIANSGIIDAALRLSEKLKTSFFSIHLDVFFVNPTLGFQEERMDLADLSQHPNSDERSTVLCTTELGIREIHSDHNLHARLGIGRTLLRPKVLLER